MHSSIDSDIFRLGFDVDGFRLDRHPPQEPKFEGQLWEWVSPQALVQQWHEILQTGRDRQVRVTLLALLTLYGGEKHQRRTIERNLISSRRNIRLEGAEIKKALASVMPLLLSSEDRRFLDDVGQRISKGPETEVTVLERLRYDQLREKLHRFKEQTYQEVPLMMEQFNPTPPSEESLVGYEITEQTMAMADSEVCREYLRSVQGTERAPIFAEKMETIAVYLREHFSDDAEVIVERIKAHPVKHFSSLSLTSERDVLLVTLVNPYGKYARVEAWKFLKTIHEHGETQRWGDLIRKGFDGPEPLLKFSNEKTGVLYAKLWPESFCLKVVCQQEVIGEDGPKVKHSPQGQAWFYLEPGYLASLTVAIERLLEDRKRFGELMEKAQTTIIHDPMGQDF